MNIILSENKCPLTNAYTVKLMLGFCFFKNIFMCSEYFGKFLAKKKKKEASLLYRLCKTNAQRVLWEFFNVLAQVCF